MSAHDATDRQASAWLLAADWIRAAALVVAVFAHMRGPDLALIVGYVLFVALTAMQPDLREGFRAAADQPRRSQEARMLLTVLGPGDRSSSHYVPRLITSVALAAVAAIVVAGVVVGLLLGFSDWD